MESSVVVVSVKDFNCPRCGNVHEDETMTFKPVGGKPIGSFTHYAFCPDDEGPVLATVSFVTDTPTTSS